MTESYTPGHLQNSVDFMSLRTIDTHGGFIKPWVRRGQDLLDCGCGPGTMTCGLAKWVLPGTVTGVDAAESQIEQARLNAEKHRISNATFKSSSVYELPFEAASFDGVFSHALFEHLRQPERAVSELFRVLRPGGFVGLCSPDWGGFLLAPTSNEVEKAIEDYKALQIRNGGNVYLGRSIGELLLDAGFIDDTLGARYETYQSAKVVAEYLATQLERENLSSSATALRVWSNSPSAMFAQAWIHGVGIHP